MQKVLIALACATLLGITGCAEMEKKKVESLGDWITTANSSQKVLAMCAKSAQISSMTVKNSK